jgi:hypothetical protein
MEFKLIIFWIFTNVGFWKTVALSIQGPARHCRVALQKSRTDSSCMHIHTNKFKLFQFYPYNNLFLVSVFTKGFVGMSPAWQMAKVIANRNETLKKLQFRIFELRIRRVCYVYPKQLPATRIYTAWSIIFFINFVMFFHTFTINYSRCLFELCFNVDLQTVITLVKPVIALFSICVKCWLD